MAVVLLDTGVITDLAQPGSEWFEWSASTLERLDDENVFIIKGIGRDFIFAAMDLYD